MSRCKNSSSLFFKRKKIRRCLQYLNEKLELQIVAMFLSLFLLKMRVLLKSCIAFIQSRKEVSKKTILMKHEIPVTQNQKKSMVKGKPKKKGLSDQIT